MRRTNPRRRPAGTAALEKLVLLAAVAVAGSAGFARLGGSFSDAVAGATAGTGAAVGAGVTAVVGAAPRVVLASQAALGAAHLARVLAAVPDTTLGGAARALRLNQSALGDDVAPALANLERAFDAETLSWLGDAVTLRESIGRLPHHRRAFELYPEEVSRLPRLPSPSERVPRKGATLRDAVERVVVSEYEAGRQVSVVNEQLRWSDEARSDLAAIFLTHGREHHAGDAGVATRADGTTLRRALTRLFPEVPSASADFLVQGMLDPFADRGGARGKWFDRDAYAFSGQPLAGWTYKPEFAAQFRQRYQALAAEQGVAAGFAVPPAEWHTWESLWVRALDRGEDLPAPELKEFFERNLRELLKSAKISEATLNSMLDDAIAAHPFPRTVPVKEEALRTVTQHAEAMATARGHLERTIAGDMGQLSPNGYLDAVARYFHGYEALYPTRRMDPMRPRALPPVETVRYRFQNKRVAPVVNTGFGYWRWPTAYRRFLSLAEREGLQIFDHRAYAGEDSPTLRHLFGELAPPFKVYDEKTGGHPSAFFSHDTLHQNREFRSGVYATVGAELVQVDDVIQLARLDAAAAEELRGLVGRLMWQGADIDRKELAAVSGARRRAVEAATDEHVVQAMESRGMKLIATELRRARAEAGLTAGAVKR